MTKKLNDNAIRDIKHAKSGYEFCDKMFEHVNWLSSLANFKMKFVPIGSYHITYNAHEPTYVFADKL